MASLAKVISVALVVMIPGGLVLLVGYLLARVVRRTWMLEPDAAASLRVRRALASVHMRDLWREARAVL